MRPLRRLETYLPGLEDARYRITSPQTDTYNCVAWALGTDDLWWGPWEPEVAYWPEGLRRDDSVATYLALFAGEGFEQCESSGLESGIEKIAVFAEGEMFTHVARRLPDGRWTSKLGTNVDIEHDLEDLIRRRSPSPAYRYGQVAAFMRRRGYA